jgi:hypothetical protein
MDTYPLYNGDVILTFDDKKHVYRVNDEIVPSVTGIVEAIGGKFSIGAGWAAKMCGEYLEANLTPEIAQDEIQLKAFAKEMKSQHRKKTEFAADIGTLVHDFLHKFMTKQNPSQPNNPQAATACKKFIEWSKNHDIEVLGSEKKIYSQIFKYAGTYDLDCMFDGERTMIDFKTSAAVYPENFIQLGGYIIAVEEELGANEDVFKSSMIIRCPKDGNDIEIKRTNSVVRDTTAFMSAVDIYRRLADLKTYLAKAG